MAGKKKKRKATQAVTQAVKLSLTDHSSKSESFVLWFRGISGISIPTGFGLIRYDFLLGVSIVYLGLFFLLCTAIQDPWVLSRSLRFQVVVLLFVFIGIDLFSIKIVGAPAPLVLQSYAMKRGDYPAGTTIAGITWDSHLTDLRVAITNPTDDDYENLDIEVQPDKWTYKARLLDSPDPDCVLTPMGGNTVAFVKHAIGGVTTFTGTHVGMGFEAHDSVGDVFTTLATGLGYRLRCAKMPAHFTVRVVLAVVALSPFLTSYTSAPINGPMGSWNLSAAELAGVHSEFELLDPRPSPSLVRLTGRYTRNLKPFKIAKTMHVDDGN